MTALLSSKKNWFYLFVIVYGIYLGFNYSVNFSIPGINIFFFLIILCGLVASFYTGTVYQQIMAVIAFSFFGIDTVLFLCFFIVIPPLIFVISERKALKVKLPVLIFTFLGIYVLLISIIGNLMEPFWLSSIMGLATYGGGIILFIYFSLFAYTREKLFNVLSFFRNLIICQLILVWAQFFIDGSYRPGDYGMGSFGNTGKSGLFITLLFVYDFLVPILFSKVDLRFLIKRSPYFLFLVFALILIDAKLIYLSTVIAIVLCFLGVFATRIMRNRLPVRIILCLSGALITLTIFFPFFFRFYLKNFLNETLDLNKIIYMYTKDPEYSQKFTFYKNVYGRMAHEYPATFIFGTGVGKLGSRASNTFASDILYKDPASRLPAFIPVYSSSLTKRYMKNLYTKQIYDTMRWRSANLSFPFAGIVSIKAEFGLIGLLLFLAGLYLIVVSLIRRSYSMENDLKNWGLTFAIFGYTLIILLFFDNYQEMPPVTYPFFILSSMYLCTKD